MVFFFNDTATTEIYTLSLHDALPISRALGGAPSARRGLLPQGLPRAVAARLRAGAAPRREERRHAQRLRLRSEEHTSELQSRQYLVCRLLLEKKKQPQPHTHNTILPY